MNKAAVNKLATGGWRVADSRVSLESIVHAYWNGESTQSIVDSFPTLSTEQVEQALQYYLQNKAEVDAYMKEQEKRWASFEKESRAKHAALIERISRGASTPV